MYKSNLVVQTNPKLSINAWIYIKEMKKEKKKNDQPSPNNGICDCPNRTYPQIVLLTF